MYNVQCLTLIIIYKHSPKRSGASTGFISKVSKMLTNNLLSTSYIRTPPCGSYAYIHFKIFLEGVATKKLNINIFRSQSAIAFSPSSK